MPSDKEISEETIQALIDRALELGSILSRESAMEIAQAIEDGTIC